MDNKLLQAAVDALKVHGTVSSASAALDISERAMYTRLAQAKAKGIKADPDIHMGPRSPQGDRSDVRELESTVERLTAQVRALAMVRDTAKEVQPPTWLLKPSKVKGAPGVPTLFLSDLHYGEVVDPAQIGGVSCFNLAIADDRLKRMIETTILLLKEHMTCPEYPGIVFAWGGDLFSGDIHEELTATNEEPLLKCFVRLQGRLIWMVEELKKAFGKVFIPVVVGNHGRNTRKPTCKNAMYTNFDWLIAKMVEKHFENDPDVTFLVSDSLDCQWKVYNTVYQMTHGDQFNGGSGIAGILSPIMLGDHRKRKRAAAIKQPYDYLLMGHWHQLMQARKLIVNGSVKGYDEYAYRSNFDFEPPQQALWTTHPTLGINYWMPIQLEPNATLEAKPDWCAWRA